MRNIQSRNRESRRGAALVEFAIVVPLIFLLCMAAGDFGRLFFHAVTVANAASTGAVYGARDNIKSGDFAGMEQKATEDAGDLTGVTATGGQFCQCPDGTAVDCKDILVTTCPGYGQPRGYVRTNVEQTFQVLGPYPGIPRTTLVNRTAIIRAQ